MIPFSVELNYDAEPSLVDDIPLGLACQSLRCALVLFLPTMHVKLFQAVIRNQVPGSFYI